MIHVLLGLGAAYYVVQVTYPKKKNFAGGAPTQSASHQAIEHKVSMAKTQQRSSAPPAAARVTTTGASKVALPSMPTTPMDSSLAPTSMNGMGGAGIGSVGGLGGVPLLPVFKLGSIPTPTITKNPNDVSDPAPPVAPDTSWSVWKAAPPASSL